MDYSNSLLLRLEEDEATLSSSLSSAPSSSSIPLARDLATRKILAATPSAIDTLVEVSRSGDDKSRVAAASKLLSYSSAVDNVQNGMTATLPAEALTSIVSALSSFARAALAEGPQSSALSNGQARMGEDEESYRNVTGSILGPSSFATEALVKHKKPAKPIKLPLVAKKAGQTKGRERERGRESGASPGKRNLP